jgi:hypothetical protein
MKIIAFLALFSTMIPTATAIAAPSLTESQKAALVSAIEDEIYDYKLERNFELVGKRLSNGTVEVPLFITAESTNSDYKLIYRLMPYGELYRLATTSSDGLVRLFRNPNIGFPPDSPAMLTLYYDDGVICAAKQQSLKNTFIVELHPSKQTLQKAIANQKLRYGFSNLAREIAKRRQLR